MNEELGVAIERLPGVTATSPAAVANQADSTGRFCVVRRPSAKVSSSNVVARLETMLAKKNSTSARREVFIGTEKGRVGCGTTWVCLNISSQGTLVSPAVVQMALKNGHHRPRLILRLDGLPHPTKMRS